MTPARIARRLPSVVLLLAALLAACSNDPSPDRSGGFGMRPVEERRRIVFAPDSAVVPGVEARALAARPPGTDVALVLPAGPLAAARAISLRSALAVPDAPLNAPTREDRLGPDEAVVILRRQVLTALSCLGPGEGRRLPFVPLGFNPAGTLSSGDLLPAGCAHDAMLLRFVANQDDLFRGQPLEPGAAGPVARAAERYINRNEAETAAGTAPPPQLRRGAEPADTVEPALEPVPIVPPQ